MKDLVDNQVSYPDTQLLIGGAWRPARSGQTVDVINPATESVIGQLAVAGEVDLEDAVKAAEAGFRVWREATPLTRSGVLRKAAELLRARADQIAPIMSFEQGKPVSEAHLEINASAEILEWFAEEARRTYGRVIPPRIPGALQTVRKEPVGVIAAFTPWNFPISQAARKLGAALAAGCAVVIKPPEEAPASPAALARALVDAGLPDGVLNVVYGVPSEVSEYLIPHPSVRKISFTGSTPVGKHLAQLAGAQMKRITMELGGHAPAIICDDADIERAAEVLATSKFRNAGQVCIAPTRFLVQDSVHDAFVQIFREKVEAILVGNGLDETSTMGALANERRLTAMEELIGDAIDQGATLVTGGRRLGNKGYFYTPTILTDVPLSARAMIDEPFGPVALVRRFNKLEDALVEANRLAFGLASYAFTGSVERANRISDSIEAGMLTINHYGIAFAEVPFGGVKDSGYGSEGGLEAVEAYLATKFVSLTA